LKLFLLQDTSTEFMEELLSWLAANSPVQPQLTASLLKGTY
jgi:hypothetical protein